MYDVALNTPLLELNTVLDRTLKVLNSKSVLKGALSGLRQFLATESPLKIMKNTFYFTLKVGFHCELT